MTGEQTEIKVKPRSRSVLNRVLYGIVYATFSLAFLLVLIAAGLLIRVKTAPLAIPAAQETVERLANEALKDFDVTVGEVSLVMPGAGFNTQVQISDMVVSSKTGQEIVALPVVRTTVDPVQLIKTGVDVEVVEVLGPEIRVLRDRNGQFNFLPADTENTAVITPDVIFENVNEAVSKAPLNTLKLITLTDTEVTYVDQLNGNIWRSTKTTLKAERADNVITADADIVLQSQGRNDTSAGLRLSYTIEADDFNVGLRFENATTKAIAEQVPALSFVGSFDTAVTGSLNAALTTEGSLAALSGVLEADQGRLLDAPEAHPIEFDQIKTYFEYDKAADRFDFTEVIAKSSVGHLAGESSITILRDDTGAVASVLGGIDLRTLELYPEGVFEAPIVVDAAHADVELTLSPLTITLKNGAVTAEEQMIHVSGASVAGPIYWNNTYHLSFDQATRDEVIKYWPVIAKPNTRKWIKENVRAGFAKNGRAKLTTQNGALGLDFKFDIADAKVRYLKTLPLLQSAYGTGHLTEKTFSASLSTGHVISTNGDEITLDGSTFEVADLTLKPAMGDIGLKATSSLQGALSILDEKPFEFLKKVNLEPTLGIGQAEVTGKLSVPLAKGVSTNDVVFDANAVITELQSKVLVKGRTITADQMALHADNSSLVLTGNAKLDGLLAKTEWQMPIGKEHKGRSSVISDVVLNDENLRILGVEFGKGVVTGAANGRFEIAFEKGKQPQYSLTSNPRNARGDLQVSGRLGGKFTVDAFTVNTAGLKAQGAIVLNDDSTFRRADFSNVKIGNWLDVAASLSAIGGGKSTIAVHSGTADLRKASFSNAGQGGAGPSLDVALNRLILSDSIALTNLRAKLQNNKGLRGEYTAQVNGGAQIKGTIFPQPHGTAVEVVSAKAGDVLRSANLYQNGHDGELRMVALPTEKNGEYKGTFKVKKFRIKQDSVLADILNGISVVGLVQQLLGDGIVFENIDGQFNLKPKGVEVRKASAVGPSIGITLDGTYSSETELLNFEGVVTPVYAINGTFERVFGKVLGRTKGEGLFSFVYKLSGPPKDPKISVNPFSVLAPGAVRELFRTNIPNVDAPVSEKPEPVQIEEEAFPSGDEERG